MTEDDRISALFAGSEGAPDEAFVARVARAVRAEQQMAAARRASWRRFAIETIASAAIVTAFYLLWRLARAEPPPGEMPFAPTAAAILVLAIWFGVVLRPAAAGR